MATLGYRRLVGALAASVLAAGAFTAPALADEATQNDLNKAKSAQSQTSKSISDLEVELAQLAAQSNDLGTKVAQAQADSIGAERALTDAIGAAAASHEAADQAADKANAAKSELGRISTALYRDGTASISGASYLLGAESIQDANDRARAYDIVGADADKVVQKYEALQSVADTMKSEAEKKTKAQQKAADKAEAAEQAVSTAKEEVDTKSAVIADQRTSLITQLAAQKGTTAAIESQLQDQREAAGRQAAAAQQQAIRDQAAQNATRPTQPTTPPVQPTTPPVQPTTPPVQPTTPPTTPPTTGGGGSSNGGGSSSATGKAIVNYAMGYTGVPYVWAGTTPSGWDCIGFVRYVYRNFGVNIGGYTTSVLSVGTRVPYSDVRPGDILYWPGHVAISVGNGQNVGAWNESWGTRVGKDSWVGTNPTVIRVFK